MHLALFDIWITVMQYAWSRNKSVMGIETECRRTHFQIMCARWLSSSLDSFVSMCRFGIVNSCNFNLKLLKLI